MSQLNRLGRWFVEAARTAAAQDKDPAMPAGEMAVLADVLTHPASAVGEIAERTGFVQSYVSSTVVRLKEQGAVNTTTDSEDRRRTLVSVPDRVAAAIVQRADKEAAEAIVVSLGGDAEARRAVDLIEELLSLVLPRITAGSQPVGKSLEDSDV